jgi:hypothetical protein
VTLNRQPVSGQTWDGIRADFTLPALEQVRRRLCELMEDPEPVMRQLVRHIYRTLNASATATATQTH